MVPVRIVLATLGIAVVSGCAVNFNYGARPLGPPPTTPQESCYQERRLERGTGSAWASWFEQGPQIGYVQLVYAVTREARGMTFYQGGQRLELPTVMRGLKDPELAQAYAKRLAELESASTSAATMLGVGIGGQVVGLSLVLGSLGLMPSDGGGDFMQSSRGKAMMGMIGAGAVVMVVGSFLTWIGARRYRHATFEEQVYRNLMVDPNLEGRVAVRLRQNNQRAAQSCGLEATAEERPAPAPRPQPAPQPGPALPDPYAE